MAMSPKLCCPKWILPSLLPVLLPASHGDPWDERFRSAQQCGRALSRWCLWCWESWEIALFSFHPLPWSVSSGSFESRGASTPGIWDKAQDRQCSFPGGMRQTLIKNFILRGFQQRSHNANFPPSSFKPDLKNLTSPSPEKRRISFYYYYYFVAVTVMARATRWS